MSLGGASPLSPTNFKESKPQQTGTRLLPGHGEVATTSGSTSLRPLRSDGRRLPRQSTKCDGGLHSHRAGYGSASQSRSVQLNGMSFHYVYILQSVAKSDHFYVGLTEDLHERLHKHNAGDVPHTSKFKPWVIKTAIAFSDRARASAFTLSRVQAAHSHERIFEAFGLRPPKRLCAGGHVSVVTRASACQANLAGAYVKSIVRLMNGSRTG